jgi:hypothetical protein
MSADDAIVCSACQRRFAFKPHLAGRTITCKCGAPITVPGGAVAEAKSAQFRTLILAGGAIAVILIGLMLLKTFGPRFSSANQTPDPNAPVPNMPGEDGRVMAQINAGQDHEALQWVKASNDNAVTGLAWTHDLTQKYIQLWYNNGAVKVLAFGQNFWTPSLAIELPQDKGQRKYFFDYSDHFYEDKRALGYPVQTDVNQKYLVIYFVNPNAKPLDTSQLP